MTRRTALGSGAALAALASLPSWAGRLGGNGDGAPFTATAITRVFGEGMKLVAVALEYATPVEGRGLSPALFQVEGRTVTAVYASHTAQTGHGAAEGRFVIVELSPDDPSALLLQQPTGNGGQRSGPGGNGAGPGGPGGNGPGGNGHGPRPGGGGGPRSFPSPTLKPATASIVQTGPVHARDGSVLPASATPVATREAIHPIVDDFRQRTFQAPDGGGSLAYNLFVPRNYDPKKKYPLVLFVHDAGTLSANPLVTLAQGLGAVVWASPEDQSKRECFVVAPQFAAVAEGEKTGAGSSMDLVHGLLLSLAQQYSVDMKRLYSTGQSMGAMLSIAMNIAYPGFFAASFLVAGQWDAEAAAPLAKDKLWIVVSQGDERAYPGENAMAAVWEKEGAKISRAVWNGRADAAEFNADVRAMEAQGNAIHYAALLKGTVVPPTQSDTPISNHLNTWRIAYTIEGIRAWLFDQRLATEGKRA